jgi:acyl transferase domain-containing protein/acyl carrier protein
MTTKLLEHLGAIAIIGMAGRFPGARNVEQFRQNMENGVESVTFFSDEELLGQGVPPARLHDPNYVKAAPLLDDYDLFDAAFFEYSPREAELMDPQHRILLECAWEALENAGYAPRREAHRSSPSIGVFAGSGGLMSSYLLSETHFNPRLIGVTGSRAHIGNDKDYLSTRISYKLNLQGPSMTVQTACSTSLVAVHLACQSLLNGECDMAIAGGVSVRVPQRAGYMFQEGEIFSPDGHCRPFDADSQGTIFGSGVGLVVLKPLKNALRDGDSIDAVIRGSAINNDGGQKVSYWATRAEGQIDAISRALAIAKVAPETIGYVETHGTGTLLGDPVEVFALSKAFSSTKKQFCAIGSVKSNIGHLEAAAGVTGLIKAVLSLKHKKRYPSLNFSTPNPRIKFEKTPFFVNTTLSEWPTTAFPRRAAVNSLGIGGTNAHLILEEAPVLPLPQSLGAVVERPLHLLTLSAKTPEALQVLLSRYHQHIAAQPTQSWADLCYTANTGRVHFEHRMALNATRSESALEALNHALDLPNAPASPETLGIQRGQVESTGRPRIAFLFTGQGSQYVGMGRQLYETQPTFRHELERCHEILQPILDWPLLSILYPERKSAIDKSEIDETTYTQPALFALEYALAQLWHSWGIEPDGVMGHSVGEYVAACVAGVFSLEDALKLIAARGRLMGALPQDGAMVSLMASEALVQKAIVPVAANVSIASVNGPENVVISGKREAVHAVAKQLASDGVKTQELNVSHAFHSSLMEPMLEKFRQVAEGITYRKPKLSLVSNITGKLADDEVTTAAYWVRHVREAVRFADGVTTLHEQSIDLFLEIGPKPTLLGMARLASDEASSVTYLPSLRKSEACLEGPENDWQQMLSTLGELYVRGAQVDWASFDQAYPRRKVALPTYPFQSKRYWIESSELVERGEAAHLTFLIDQLTQLPRHKEIICETTFSVARLPFLADHTVFGKVISPGTCQLAMVLDAAQLAYPQETFGLVDIVLPQPLVLGDINADDKLNVERTVQVILRYESPSAGRQAGIAFEMLSFQAEQAEDTLQTHASGKLIPMTAQIPAVELASLQRRCPTVVEVDWLDAHDAALQLHYGQTFRWLRALWIGQGEAIARLRLPTAVAQMDDYPFHPALLAACLRITNAVKRYGQEEAYQDKINMPFAFASFQQLGDIKGEEWWCHAQLVDEEQWQIQLLDNEGTVLVQIEGYTERAATGKWLFGHEAWREWLYEVKWQPQPRFGLAPRYLPDLVTLGQVVQRAGADGLTAPDVQQQIAALRELDALCVDYILAAFADAGFHFEAGSKWQSRALARQIGVIPTYHRLLDRLLQLLSEAAILRPIGMAEHSLENQWLVLQTPQLRSPQDEFRRLQTKYGALVEAEGHLLARCAENLSAVLRGAQEPLELLFPQGDTTLVNRTYQDSPLASALNRMMQEAVKSALAQLPAGQGVRILEIGAGTGGTTASILPLLPSEQTDYLFTDIGATFLLAAQKKFANYPFVRYQRLDIEQSPAEQGVDLQHYDIVIAANVLHATAEMSTTLAHVQSLLQPGGLLLLLLENTTPSGWVDLTFGLTDGWWRFTDHALRPDHPLLSVQKWSDLLADSGFSQTTAISLDEEDQTLPSPQTVFLARRALEQAKQIVEPSGRWLILADQSGVGQKISRSLSARGQECILVFLRDAHQKRHTPSQFADGQPMFTVSNTCNDFQKLLREMEKPIQGVIHCWSLDATVDETASPEQLESATEQGCGSALYWVQALLKEELTPPLWLITQGAQPVAAHLSAEGLTGVIQSSLWGLGRVIAQEHPELNCKLVDWEPDNLGGTAGEREAQAFVAQLLATGQALSRPVESQLAFRQGQSYVPRLRPIPANPEVPREGKHTRYRADATYLIAGGSKGIGFEIAQWMVKQGAKHLVLVGRHAPDAAMQARIAQLSTSEVQVTAAQADVSQKEQIASVLSVIEETMPPLRGIVHSAGVFDDRLVQDQKWGLFRKVFAPKVMGTWNLHTLTKALPLDFFILFSSSASLLGTAGLSNYAAANAFVDAFTHHRRALGLPALSINWGAWKEVGMAAAVGKERERQWEAMGFVQMAPQDALAAFEHARQNNLSQVGIFPITWSKFLSHQSTSTYLSFFEALSQDLQTGLGQQATKRNHETSAAEGATFRKQLEASVAANRESLLAERVKTLVIQMLGLESTVQLERRQGFFELGMDSLMITEFRNRLQTTFEVNLPPTLFFKYPTLGALIDYLADVLAINAMASLGNIAAISEASPGWSTGKSPEEPSCDKNDKDLPRNEAIDDLDDSTASKLARLESLLKEI